MLGEPGYVMEEETTIISDKQMYWDTAIGLNKVDDLEPSEYLRELAKENINGKLKYDEVEKLINEYYKPQDLNNEKIQNENECDIVSIRIAKMLEDNSFGFSPMSLLNIHRYLFEGIYDFAGKYRTYNITKKETILYGDTVKYVNHNEIESYLEYDFSKEKEYDYSKIQGKDTIKHISEFTSSIWQIHPFGEGNTRTTAVFIEKYLNSMGYIVNNEMFEKYSVYFRNSLVRANYGNIPKGIYPTNKYLIAFFENLLLGKTNRLEEKELFVNELLDNK